LLTNLIMYTVSLIVIGFLGFVLNPHMFLHFNLVSKTFIMIGYVILFFLCAFFILILKKDSWIRAIAMFFINICSKLRIIKNKDKKIRKLDNLISQYRDATNAMKGRGKLLFNTFIFNFLQRLSSLSTVVFVYLAFGGAYKNIFDILGIQTFVVIGSNSMPVPGAMGVSDYLLLDGLSYISDIKSISTLELVSRGISFYACVVISAIILIVGYIRTKIRKKEDI